MEKKYKTHELQPDILAEAAASNQGSGQVLSIILGESSSRYERPSPGRLIALTRTGVAKSSLKSLAFYLGVTMEELSAYLHSSYRNIQRKRDDELLDITKTEKVLELAAFAQRGLEVFGSQANFAEWLQSPLIALDGSLPKSLLDTSFGIGVLTDLLGRIEYGVYS